MRDVFESKTDAKISKIFEICKSFRRFFEKSLQLAVYQLVIIQ